jgi:hypothetical protein
VPGSPLARGHFGYAVAAGNFNGDQYADAAIGVHNTLPGTDATSDVDGSVTILYGSPSGLHGTTAAQAMAWHIAAAAVVNDENQRGFDMYLATGVLRRRLLRRPGHRLIVVRRHARRDRVGLRRVRRPEPERPRNLDPELTEVVRLCGIRNWIEQSYKHVKDELGWADFQVRSAKAISRHQTWSTAPSRSAGRPGSTNRPQAISWGR